MYNKSMKKMITLITISLFLLLFTGCGELVNLNYFVSDYQNYYTNREYYKCDEVLLEWCDFVIESNKTNNEGRSLKSYQFINKDYFRIYCEKINNYLLSSNTNIETISFLVDTILTILPENYTHDDILFTKSIYEKVNNLKTYEALCKQNDKMILNLEIKVLEKGSIIDLSNHRFFFEENYLKYIENAKNEYLKQYIEYLKPIE